MINFRRFIKIFNVSYPNLEMLSGLKKKLSNITTNINHKFGMQQILNY